MKCPCCGKDMFMDSHTKIDKYMCYDCGYIEGRNISDDSAKYHETNFERLRKLNFNESVAFIANGLGLNENNVNAWMEHTFAKSAR